LPKIKPALPHTEQCEKGLLCSLILNPPWVSDLCKFRNVEPDWFYDGDREKLFTALMEMKLEKAVAGENVIPIGQYCEENQKRFNFSADITSLLLDVSTFIGTSSNAPYYLDKLQEYAAKRRAILGAKNSVLAIEQSTNLQEIYDVTSKVFASTHEICVQKESEDYDQVAMMSFLDKMEELSTGTRKPEFFITGLPAHDEECGGLSRGELLLIRGRKGTGKSLLGQKIISMNCLEHGSRRAGIWTYEMPYDQMMRRLVADLGNVSLKSMRDGRYTKGELDSFQKTVSKIMASNVKIYDTKRLKHRTPEALFASIRRHAKNHGLDLILIDHLHLIKFPKGKGVEKRADEQLHDFSSELKGLCLELEVAGILLAQENVDGGTFGGSQVETDCDTSICLLPEFKEMNGFKRVVGTNGIFYDKCREGNLLGRKIPVKMEGQYARINQDMETGGKF